MSPTVKPLPAGVVFSLERQGLASYQPTFCGFPPLTPPDPLTQKLKMSREDQEKTPKFHFPGIQRKTSYGRSISEEGTEADELSATKIPNRLPFPDRINPSKV